MRAIWITFVRELRSYFATPVAWVFIVIFLALSGALTFFVGDFFGRGQADLQTFFTFHPWLYLLLIPAVAMRLWAEERRGGTIELLLTLPLTLVQAVIAKFLAAWAFIAIALAGTLPMWLTVDWLGRPDNGVIVAGYLGSLFMAGAYLAIGAAMSALTKSQAVAFVIAAAVCFLFTAAGSPLTLGLLSSWLPAGLVEGLASFSFLVHVNAIMRGVIDLRDVVFFGSTIVFFLFVNVIVLDLKKAE